MKLTREQRRVLRALLRHKSEDFAELAALTGLDPATDFEDADLSGVDFGTADIGAFNFGKANLDDANLSQVRGRDRAVLPVALRRVSAQEFWGEERGPSWASDWGIDAHGRWVTFSVTAANGTRVAQSMRWIPPGRFMIGSPRGEPGRDDDEGPQQAVTIAEGFWMFDTVCTEALWEAVTGKAPEPRRGAAFPVTNVSWHDAQDFIKRLNATRSGLALSLPSEARWEYACRAGTVTPYNFGTEISRDLVCYGTDAPVPAGSLPPNGWGLYEMHGNVWEWCADHWHDSYKGLPQNGSVWLGREGAADRVVRGGAWNGAARFVRAAYRDRDGPALRIVNLGFRCARVQSGSEERLAERRAGRSKPSERSETAATTSPKRGR